MRGRKSEFKKITALGETRSVTEWSVISGIPRELIYARLRKGLSADKVLFTPVRDKYKPRKPKTTNKVKDVSEKVIKNLISKDRMQKYRTAGMWYRIFQLEDRSAMMKVA